jgi:molybdopterin-guanine dinucleotide biosynthesis protein A
VQALEQASADAAVARTAERAHSAICLCKVSLGDRLAAFIDGGGRKVGDWQATLNMVYVDFDEQRERFRNVNTLDDLRDLESFVRR